VHRQRAGAAGGGVAIAIASARTTT
jgi:hypothetical protein